MRAHDVLVFLAFLGGCGHGGSDAAPSVSVSSVVVTGSAGPTKVPDAAMKIFLEEMAKRHVDLSHYQVHLHETPESFILFTMYENRKPGQRGSDPDFPEYEVEISRKDLSLVRANGVK